MTRRQCEKECPICHRTFIGVLVRKYCSRRCARKADAIAHRRCEADPRGYEPPETPALEVERQLRFAVEFENLPPWVRHPEPWTDVRRVQR